MERHNLHRRIAINILLAVGTAQRRIVLGFILATAFLSMWISNTASTMIMLPIALAVVDKLGKKGTHFAKSLFLGIAYGASVGGIATLVGTPPNIVLAGQMRNIFPDASAFGSSGLSKWIGTNLAGLGNLSTPLLIIAISTTMTFLTEFTSNTATATLMLPILASAAVGMSVDPRLLMIPATLSDTCAFMLPVATPPNAIVFGSGQLKIKEMVKAGILLNIAGIIVVLLVMYFIGMPALGIHTGVLPGWAK
ncbi:anion permease [bacterium]|nr:anion permease [bacterium]